MASRAGHRLTTAATGAAPDGLSLSVIPPAIGAEVEGVDLSRPLEPERLAAIRQALADRHLLVFSDQRLTRDQHKAFAALFGPLHVHPYHAKAPGADREVLVVKADETSANVNGEEWHTDVTCHEAPPWLSLLYITRTPEPGGGDTLFASTARAFEALSEPMQAFLAPLTAMHEGAKLYTGNYDMAPPPGGWPKAVHPVVIRHPESGRPCLYVNRGFTTRIEGLGKRESEAVLEMLFRHVETNPEFQCRVRWTPGTLVMWDNLSTQHCAVWDYYPHSRYGERVSVVGESPQTLLSS